MLPKRVIYLTTSLLWLLNACSSVPARATDVEVRRLRPDAPTYVFNSTFVDATQKVITDAVKWREAWQQVMGANANAISIPAVNFAHEVVVLVASGRHTSGGYSIRIASTRLAGTVTVVMVHSEQPGPSCVVTMAITSPVDVAVMPKPPGAVRFEFEQQVNDCE